MCGHDNETLYHALIECEHARSFWRSAEEFFGLNLRRLLISLQRIHNFLCSMLVFTPFA
jgi:hypothetical protein